MFVKQFLAMVMFLAIVGVLVAMAGFATQYPAQRMMPQASLPAPSGLAAGEEHLVDGRAMQATKGVLTLRTDEGRSVKLRMDDNTDVLLDGEKADRDELQDGDVVRAAYQGAAASEPTAIRVEARSPTPRRHTSEAKREASSK